MARHIGPKTKARKFGDQFLDLIVSSKKNYPGQHGVSRRGKNLSMQFSFQEKASIPI